MKNNKIKLPIDIYYEHLKVIKGIKFTPREIDILACMLNGRSTKTIPSFLSISSKTVSTHLAKIRAKVGCSSRESLIDFIETSDKISWIKHEYYLSLSTQIFFEKQLRKAPRGGSAKTPLCLIVYEREQKEKHSFIYYLEDHLKSAGIKTESKIKDGSKFSVSPFNEIDCQPVDYILYVISETLIPHFRMNQNSSKNQEASSIVQKTLQPPTKLIFLLSERKDQVEGSKNFEKADYVDFSKQQNYYLSCSELLKRIQPSYKFDKIIEEFRQFCEENYISSTTTYPHEIKASEIIPLEKTRNRYIDLFLILKRRSVWVFTVVFLSIGIYYISPFIFLKYNLGTIEGNDKKTIRSDLSLPTESAFLDRPELITQIDSTLKKHSGIQTVALVGLGGAGKTTLARQYAHTQDLPVVWEINAETRESLKNSFENLAQGLSKTEEDNKTLRGIQEINNPTEKKERIILFVKEHLKKYSNWFLIFDNVEKFSDIQEYFPQDSSTWGVGNIILTTRDSNIQNNKYVGHAIPISELTSHQKLSLFTKIMKSQKTGSLTSAQMQELKKFLEEIPPFPLDVSVAAYYLKATNIPYSRYLERLSQYNNDFENVQENILKESGDYVKTRYKIITLSLKNLTETNEDFGELLLFISLLDSQNIPRGLLSRYKNDTVVDDFIYNLRKYSFILNESSSSTLEPTFSIHRSTQKISLAYLIKTLNLEKNSQLLNSISYCIENYIADAINDEDLTRMQLIISHCKKLLSHNNLLTDGMRGGIRSELGNIYYYFEYDDKAKKILEDALADLNKNKIENHYRLANTLVYTGTTYRQLGNYKKAKDLLEQSLILYKKQSFKNHTRVAYALAHLGMVYRNLGEYTKAKDLLERSIVFYKKQLSENHVRVAWALSHLGMVYMMLGNGEKAKEALKESLMIYKKHFSEDHIGVAQVLGYLGTVYRSLGEYEKAKDLLEQCFLAYRNYHAGDQGDFSWIWMHQGEIYRELSNYEKAKEYLKQSLIAYKKYSPEDYKGIAQTSVYLGKVYRELDNYEEAKNLIEKSLITYENHYGKDHIETAKVLGILGQVYLLKDNFKTAEGFLQNALDIFQKSKHPEIYLVLEGLADLNLKKSISEAKKENKLQSQRLKAQAMDYLEQALEIVKANFPKNSRHIMRIQNKLKRSKVSC